MKILVFINFVKINFDSYIYLVYIVTKELSQL